MGDEFLARLHRGERPDVSSFAARDPAHAEEIRDFLSVLLLVEGLKPQGDLTDDVLQGGSSKSGPSIDRLGDFRIVREIGRGGMGIVYEAEQQSLCRHVALKVLAPGFARTSQQVRRFLREARAAARLHHTNIVPVFEVGEHDGLYYYAMQFIPGSGLDQVIEEVRRLKGHTIPGADDAVSATRQGTCDDSETRVAGSVPLSRLAASSPLVSASTAFPLEPSALAASTDSESRYAHAVARVGLQVAEALEYAHLQGTIHRDVKPSNILLDFHGVAWVTDFGLAKAAEDENLTHTGDLVGTIRYMAPERFRGVCDAGSDVYGLGLALYELLALRAAFDACERERLLYQVSHVDPPRLGGVNPDVPSDLETIVHKAIEKDPAHRYLTAADLAEDLRRFLEDRPIRARRVSSTERLTRWARRNPGLATLGTALAGMLTLVVIVIAAADLRLRRQHSETMFQLRRAEHAEGDAMNKLLDSYVAHARASRRTQFAGRRFEGLRAIARAVPLSHGNASRLELRNEAIACLALPDLQLRDPWPVSGEDGFPGVDFDPVTGRIARGTRDGTVHVRSAEDPDDVVHLPGNGLRAVFVRFSPDGRYLAVKHEERGKVRLAVWEVGRAAKILDVPEGMCADALDFHPDGGTVAAGRRDGSIVLYDLADGRFLRRLAPGGVPQTLRFDPSGHRIAVVSPDSRESVQVRRACDGVVEASWELTGLGYSVDWHPDGRWLAMGADDGRIRILDAEDPSRTPRIFKAHDGHVIAVSYNPSGDLLASASWDGTLRLWDAHTGRELVKTPLPEARPIRFSRDGRLLGPCHDGDSSWLWEVAAGDECRSVAGAQAWESPRWLVRYLASDDVLILAGAPGVRLEHPSRDATSTLLAMPGTTDVAVAPDGSFLISSGASGILRWPIQRPSPQKLLIGPPEPIRPLAGVPTGRIRLGRDGQILAVVVDDERGLIRILDLKGGAPPVTLAGHRSAERLDLSSDGRWLATATWRGTGVKIWDVQSGALVRDLPVNESAEVVFSPDGRRLLTASGKEYVIWDTNTWELLVRIPRSQSSGLPGVAAFSPDGRLLAIARSRSTVQLVNAWTGVEQATLEAPEPRNVSGLGFSPDGRLLTVTFGAPNVLVWDLDAIQRGLAVLGLNWPAPNGRRAVPLAEPGPLAIVVEPAPWLAHMERGESLAYSGRWDEAAAAFDAAIAAGAPHVEARFRRALFLRARDDGTAYREACQELLRTFEMTDISPRTVNDIAWTCALGTAAVDDYASLIRLVERAIAARPEPSRLNTLGALLYRAGRFTDAVRQLERTVEVHGAGGTAYDSVFLAMAHCQLGNVKAAREWFRRASLPAPVDMFKPQASGATSWIPQLELQVLRREAAAMVASIDL
jgi:serine/threonine protein kinase/WD40 repeat protein